MRKAMDLPVSSHFPFFLFVFFFFSFFLLIILTALL